jgi:hypothetical protein
LLEKADIGATISYLENANHVMTPARLKNKPLRIARVRWFIVR